MNTKPNDITPPKWPLKFLRFFLKKEYLEEIEGDMEEIFHEHIEIHSFKKARRMYVWEILKLFRPVLIRNLDTFKQFNQLPMFKNYFKVSLRGLIKSPVNSFINVFGLAAAIGISIFAYAFARWTYNTDQFHEHKDNVHLVTFFANRDGTVQEYGLTPRPLGEMMKADFPQVSKMCRVENRNVIVKNDDIVFHERIRYVDPEFLEMFTFPLKWGTSGSLRDVNTIILSEDMSEKYFGDENPVGRDILLKFSEEKSKSFKVGGVAKEFPASITISFNFLINFENFRTSEPDFDFHDWTAAVNATFIQVNDSSHLSSIRKGMEKYRVMQNQAAEEDWAILSFAFEPLGMLHKRSAQIKDDISLPSDSKYQSINFIIVITVFMLALACFNYINIAIVTAAKRLKEIGVRKTIGATRKVVIIQFLSENIVVTFFALIIGLLLGTFIFIPWMESLNSFSLGFTLRDWNLYIYLPVILIFTAIASGIYPSFYISRFQVVGILKGSVEFGKKNRLTKIFLGVQLVLACILISAGVFFTQNATYMSEQPWGYNQRQVLYVPVPDYAAFEKMNALVERESGIVSVSGSEHHLGKSHKGIVVRMSDKQYEVSQLSVDAKYLETMGLQLLAGRGFTENSANDKNAVVVNESFANNVASNPVGQTFRIDSVQYEVIGIVKDFHAYSFTKKVVPTILKLADKQDYQYLSVKVEQDARPEMLQKLQTLWAKLYPETPFNGGYQEDVWGSYYGQLDIFASVWKSFATIAILLAGLGLYGLVSVNVAGRVKEFSIRKILGAGVGSIAGSIGKQYFVLFVIALSIGAPISYVLNKFMFDFFFWYHMPITYAGVVIAILILIFVLLMTVSTQIGKVFKSNPVEGLKTE